ncbi:uncharacterized protein [Hyperolius riggenbachi]|uniref:uncharacterized protein isoform X2 n=1 Tax=Hyperolius riggenbachi TaxID=752182 RepID=UPI0035A3390E
MLLTQWHLSYFILGNVWCLLSAMESRVNRTDLKLVCIDNTLFLCLSAKEQTCVDTSLCMTEGEKQENKSSEDKWLLLRHSLCSEPVSNCLFTENGDYRCSLEKSQNKTAIYDLKDCWTHTSKTSNLTTEVRFSLLLLLSFVTLFLSYVGLRRALHRILARQEKTSFHLRPTRPGDTETV